MHKSCEAFLLCLFSICTVHPSRAADESRPPFQFLRYDEDYTFLADPARRTEFWDVIKYILVAGGRAGYLSFGGDARLRFEAYQNELFSPHPDADNAYFLQRYLCTRIIIQQSGCGSLDNCKVPSKMAGPGDRVLPTATPLTCINCCGCHDASRQ